MPDLLNQLTAPEIKDRLVEAYPSFAPLFDKELAKVDKERAAVAAGIASIEAEYLPKMEAAGVIKKKAEAEAKRLREASKAADAAAFQASQQLFSLDATMAQLIGKQERILRQTADPRIGRLYREISEAIDKPYGSIAPGAGEPAHNPLPEALPKNEQERARQEATRAQADYDARVAVVNTRRAALKELDALELEAIDSAELAKRLASIRARALGSNGYHSAKL